jgi:hypothetical protein
LVFFESLKKSFLFFSIYTINYEKFNFQFKRKILLDIINIESKEIENNTNLNGVIINANTFYYFKKCLEGENSFFQLYKQFINFDQQNTEE